MKKQNWLTPLHSRPVDRLALEVAFGESDRFEVDETKLQSRVGGKIFESPPRPEIQMARALAYKFAGRDFGTLSVMWLHCQGRVLCRCRCGMYEFRTTDWVGMRVSGGNRKSPLNICALCDAKRAAIATKGPNEEIRAFRALRKVEKKVERLVGGGLSLDEAVDTLARLRKREAKSIPLVIRTDC